MCYIDAMMLKALALFVVFAVALGPVQGWAQTAAHPAPVHPAPLKPAAVQTSVAPAPTVQSKPDCNGGPCEDQQPRTIYVPAPPAPVVWSWHDRIRWAAYLLLAIVGYAGIMLALSTLKKIERQTTAAETAANAAAETAHAALLFAQANASAERPWILVTAEPTHGDENSFDMTKTTRRRSPATITVALDKVLFAVDETRLPKAPDFKSAESPARFVPIILLPGESATLKRITREDIRSVCGSDQAFARIETWQEKLFVCGKVAYNNLIAPAGKQAHETRWCCWYIHGKQRSALVPAGPAEYNAHT